MSEFQPWPRSVVILLAMAALAAQVARADTKSVPSAGSAAAPVDPMDWKEPSAMPALVSGMEPGAYHKELSEAISKLDMNLMQAADEPLPEKKGPIDIDTSWKPQVAYWHSPQRNAKWDQQMFVACSVFDTKPSLAQAALQDAWQAGYKGWLVPALSARIAYNQWRFGDALNFGSFALADAPADRKPIIARWMYGAAKANYKFDEALRLAAAYQLVDGDEITRLHDAVRAYRAAGAAPRLDPLAQLSALSETDLSSRLELIHVRGSIKSPEQTNGFKKTGRMVMQAPLNELQIFAFGPQAANVELTAEFEFHAQGSKQNQEERSLTFGIVDPADKGELQCDVSLFVNGMVDAEASGPSIGVSEFPPPKWKKEGAIRIIVLGPDVEVFVDARRVYFGPIRARVEKRELGFMFRVSGVHGEISKVTWKKIESAPAAAK